LTVRAEFLISFFTPDPDGVRAVALGCALEEQPEALG
jgi:hypothetical protein